MRSIKLPDGEKHMKTARESIFRIALIVLLFSAAFLLTACGSARKVPDKTLDGVVEDYVKDHFGHLGLSPS